MPDHVHLLEDGLFCYLGDSRMGYSDGIIHETTISAPDRQEPVSYIAFDAPHEAWNQDTLGVDIYSHEDGNTIVFFVKNGFEVSVVQNRKNFSISNINDLHIDIVPFQRCPNWKMARCSG